MILLDGELFDGDSTDPDSGSQHIRAIEIPLPPLQSGTDSRNMTLRLVIEWALDGAD